MKKVTMEAAHCFSMQIQLKHSSVFNNMDSSKLDHVVWCRKGTSCV